MIAIMVQHKRPLFSMDFCIFRTRKDLEHVFIVIKINCDTIVLPLGLKKTQQLIKDIQQNSIKKDVDMLPGIYGSRYADFKVQRNIFN